MQFKEHVLTIRCFTWDKRNQTKRQTGIGRRGCREGALQAFMMLRAQHLRDNTEITESIYNIKVLVKNIKI